MLVSTKGRYALRVMLELAQDDSAAYLPLPAIAERQGISEKYLESIISVLSKAGLVDEIVDMPMMRNYIVAFTDAVYQNPESICPFHQMLLPRTIRDYDNLKK